MVKTLTKSSHSSLHEHTMTSNAKSRLRWIPVTIFNGLAIYGAYLSVELFFQHLPWSGCLFMVITIASRLAAITWGKGHWRSVVFLSFVVYVLGDIGALLPVAEMNAK